MEKSWQLFRKDFERPSQSRVSYCTTPLKKSDSLVVKPKEMGVAQDFCTSLARCRIVMDSLKPESKRDDWLLLVKGRKAGMLFTTQLDAEIDQKA